jgi:predicted nucleotidyltransferase
MGEMEDVLEALRALKPEIMARFRVREIGLFGSFVRGEQTEKSDIDVLVEFDDAATLFDLVGLAQFLEDRLHRKVDVVSKRALKVELQESVLREVQVV